MYNGIGLQTARGSGTNGYVQRNMAFIKSHKDKVDYKSLDEAHKNELNKGPNQEILHHERKRKVELKCIEMQELMEDQGYTADEIEHKVSVFRKMLMEKESMAERVALETDELGRPIAKETHQLAEATQQKNAMLRAAFGISDDYKDGTAMKKAREEQAKAKAMAEQKYKQLSDSSESSDSDNGPERKKRKSSTEKKKKKKSKKRKKQKKDR